MDNPGEILRLCRLCLVKDQVNIPIFEEQGDIRQIFLKISSCLPVKVSRDDKLPKKICDGCSNKLDLLYDFWNSSANAEKTLLSWLGQAGVKDADETISAVAQQIAKPAETQVKQEALEDGHAASQAQSYGVQSFDEEAKDESEAPPPKRARRTAAVKAQISITPESDDDDDMDSAEAMTKVEDESDESDGEDKDPSYAEVPGTSADDQAGPSGVGKDGVEAPENITIKEEIMEDDVDESNFDTAGFIPEVFIKKEKVTSSKTKDSKGLLLMCPLCKKNCGSAFGLDSHMFHCHNKTLLKCHGCKYMFLRKADLDMHLREQLHDTSKIHACLKCGLGFPSEPEYLRHLRRKHDLTYQCQYCSKLFVSKETLKNHHRGHGLDRFKCKICLKSFVQRKNFNLHMRRYHKTD